MFLQVTQLRPLKDILPGVIFVWCFSGETWTNININKYLLLIKRWIQTKDYWIHVHINELNCLIGMFIGLWVRIAVAVCVLQEHRWIKVGYNTKSTPRPIWWQMKPVWRELCVQAACVAYHIVEFPFPNNCYHQKILRKGFVILVRFKSFLRFVNFIYSSYLILSFLNLNNPTSRKECFCLKKIASKDCRTHTDR